MESSQKPNLDKQPSDVEMIDCSSQPQQAIATSIEMKYFPLFDGYLQTQLSVQMTGANYRELIQDKGEVDLAAQR